MADGGKIMDRVQIPDHGWEVGNDGVGHFTFRKKGADADTTVKIDGAQIVKTPGHRLYGLDRDFVTFGLARSLGYMVGQRHAGFIGDAYRARGDAASSYALARDLEYVSALARLQPLGELSSFAAFGMNPDQPMAYQEQYTTRNVTYTNGGRVSRSYKDIGNTTNIQVAKGSIPVVASIESWQYGIDDIERSALANLPLPALGLMAAFRAINEDVNRLNWFGDDNLGVKGIFNNSAIAHSSATAWTGLTGDQILTQFRTLASEVLTAVKQSNNTGVSLRPNTFRIPTAAWGALSKPMSNVGFAGQGSWTVAMAIRETLRDMAGGEISLESSPELDDIDGSGTMAILCYANNPMVVGRIMPVAPTTLPPDIESTIITQPVHAQSGGLQVSYPVAMRYITGTFTQNP